MKQIAPRITVDEKVRFGKPVIQGTRVAVETIVGHVAAGMPVEEVAKAYDVAREDVLACLSYAAKMVAEEHVRATK